MGVHVVVSKVDDTFFKVKLLNQYLFCTCFNYLHQGIPCEHVLLCALTLGKKFLIHQRYSIDYHKLLCDMQESARNNRLTSISDQIYQERQVVYTNFSKVILKS